MLMWSVIAVFNRPLDSGLLVEFPWVCGPWELYLHRKGGGKANEPHFMMLNL